MPEEPLVTPAQANFYRLLRMTLSPAVKDAFHMQIDGRFHLPRTGGGLVICNHRSFVDPFLLGTAVRRPINFLAASFVFKLPVFAALAGRTGAIPVDISGGKRAQPALDEAVRCLQAGQLVGIFPEGVASFRKGAAGISRFQMGFVKALAAAGMPDLPVFPCAIAGEGERTLAELPAGLMKLLDPSGRFGGAATEIRVPQRVWVGIGKPLLLGSLLGTRPDQERMLAASEAVRAQVHQLYEHGQQVLARAEHPSRQFVFGLGPVELRLGRPASWQWLPAHVPVLGQGETLLASYAGSWGTGGGGDWLLISDQKLTLWRPPDTTLGLPWATIAEVRAEQAGLLRVVDRQGRAQTFRLADDGALHEVQQAVADALLHLQGTDQTGIELALWDPERRRSSVTDAPTADGQALGR